MVLTSTQGQPYELTYGFLEFANGKRFFMPSSV